MSLHLPPSSQRLQPLPRHQRQQFQRSSARLFFAAFPLAHQPGRHMQMQREDRLGCILPQAQRADFIGREWFHRRQAKRVKAAQAALAHRAGLSQPKRHLLHRRQRGVLVSLARRSSPSLQPAPSPAASLFLSATNLSSQWIV